MTTSVPGEIKFIFNRYYAGVNPNPFLGPLTWRLGDNDGIPCGDIPIQPGTFFTVEAIAPMVVSGDEHALEYSFSMDGVPLDNSRIQAGTTNILFLKEPVFLSNYQDNPVQSIYDNSSKSTVTKFDIYGLTYARYGLTSRRSARTNVYNNSSRSIPVGSKDPVIASDNTASTDLFFNISSLPHAL